MIPLCFDKNRGELLNRDKWEFCTITMPEKFDESMNLTHGGPGNASITMSHYIYNMSFKGVPNFGYTSAMSFIILIMVAILALVQMKVGDDRE